jgi:hypothetical protein
MRNDQLADKIEAAFANTPHPGSDFGDISSTQWDEGIVDYFRGTTWRCHNVRDLRYHSCALSFFTDKAFRYWLPAFMLAELEDPEEADVIAEGIAFHLTDAETAKDCLQQFTKDELEAIAAFFDDCAQRYNDGVYDVEFRKAADSVRAQLKIS